VAQSEPDPAEPASQDNVAMRRALEASIRIGIIALLVLWCLAIVQPFVGPLLWGIVMATAARPLHERLTGLLGNRPSAAAGLLVVLALALLIGPTLALAGNLVETAATLAHEFKAGDLRVPPPPATVESWPIVGEQIFAAWSEASRNLETTLTRYAPQLKELGLWLVSTAAATGGGLLLFVISIVIAGVLLNRAEGAAAAARRIATRFAGERGAELTTLAQATVMSVTRGILGVAIGQSLLAGLGMLVVGVPGAGLWALLVLLLAVVQLPPLIVLGPVILYVFSTSSVVVAVLFAIWSLAVALGDSVVKPILMGRGVDVPMLVVFLGAIGGFMRAGIIGLFVGAVVLCVSYKLFLAWLEVREIDESRALGTGG